MKPIYCCVCGRQIVSKQNHDPLYTASKPDIFMGVKTYACIECSKDLDENGMFPEERMSVAHRKE